MNCRSITMKATTLCSVLVLSFSAQALLAQLPSGNPLSGLERLKDFETMRASSSDPNWRNGNADSRPIEPWRHAGAGRLERARRHHPLLEHHRPQAPFYSRLLTLRIYWDGEEHPSVECPIGDFFGIGHGLDKPFVSLPIKVSSDGRGPELLLADAVPQVRPHHRHQRERQALPRLLLLPRLAETQIAAQGHRLLPRDVSPGISRA